MGLDHSDAFVRLTFDGLIGFCFYQGKQQQRCEMGMVQVPDHEPLLTVNRVNPNGTLTPILTDYHLNQTSDVSLEVNDPVRPQSTRFPESMASGDFDRFNTANDPEDFRWVLDLQGKDFHEDRLRLKTGGSGDTLLRPRITVPNAIFYTLDKTQDQFYRFKRIDETMSVPIGKIADQVGADILCRPGDHGQKLVTLKVNGEPDIRMFRNTTQGNGFRYAIKITNLCRRAGTGRPLCPNQSDFPHYYKVAEDKDGVQFDLKKLYSKDDPAGTTPIDDFNAEHFPEFAGFRSNGPPQVCSLGFFGRATSIP